MLTLLGKAGTVPPPSLYFSVLFFLPKTKLIFFFFLEESGRQLLSVIPIRPLAWLPASGQEKSVPFCSWSTSVISSGLQVNKPLRMASNPDPVTPHYFCKRKMFCLLRHLPRRQRNCMLVHCTSSKQLKQMKCLNSEGLLPRIPRPLLDQTWSLFP